MRIFISTGEVSGDLQGALLIEALKRNASLMGKQLEIFALGGDRMAAAGATLLGNTTSIGSVGLFESLPFVLPTWQIQRRAKEYLRDRPPDLLILIDYLGPNLGIGSYVRKHLPKLPIFYYIAPQDWIWSPTTHNTKKIAEITDKMLAIFPAEARYFQEKGIDVKWVGHPLLDRLKSTPNKQESRQILGIGSDEIIITLLPASRRQEIKYLLPVICQAARKIQQQIPQVKFLLPISLDKYRPTMETVVKSYDLSVIFLENQTIEAIAAADLAITKSGTANLEIALLNVPQVVLYRVNPLTIWLARKLFNFSIPFMSPVNLVVMREIVPEFLQERATPDNIANKTIELLSNQEKRQQMIADYQEMRSCLGEVGVCDRAAREILSR